MGLGIIIFELSDEADLLVQLVPECWPMIAALSRSFFALMIRHELSFLNTGRRIVFFLAEQTGMKISQRLKNQLRC